MYEVTCEERPVVHLLTLSASLPQDQVGSFLNDAYPRLFGALGQAGVPPMGPPIARYRVDEAFHVTAGVPVPEGQKWPETFALDTLPGGPVAATMHVGPYDQLPEAFHAVIEWIGAQGWTIAGDPWECYLDGPEVAQPRTQVCFPVVKTQ